VLPRRHLLAYSVRLVKEKQLVVPIPPETRRRRAFAGQRHPCRGVTDGWGRVDWDPRDSGLGALHQVHLALNRFGFLRK
jgi:hypothetical protein